MLVLAVTQNVTFLVAALGLRGVIDLAANGRTEEAVVAALVTAAAFALTAAGDLVQFQLRLNLADRVGYLDLDPEIQAMAASLPGLRHLEDPRYLDRLALVRGKGKVLADGGWAVVDAVSVAVRVMVTVALLAAVHPALAGVILVAGPAVFLSGAGSRAAQRDALAAAEDERLEQSLFRVQTSPEPARQVRTWRAAGALADRATLAWSAATERRARAATRVALLSSVAGIAVVLVYMGALVFVVQLVADGTRTAGSLVMAITLAAGLRGLLERLLYVGTKILAAMVVMAPYQWLQQVAAQNPSGGEEPPDRLVDGIALDQVQFTYPGASRPAVGPLSVRLPAGSVVAVVGAHGSGKSTLIKLLAGFYDPDEGQVLVDGRPVSAMDRRAWHARLSAAFQDFGRHQVLLREAVGLGDLAAIADSARVRTALATTAAEEVEESLPHGLETQLGRLFPGGVDLSEGQWQAVALARAAMRTHPLLVLLDESTASLDAPREDAVLTRQAELARRTAQQTGAVTVMVSHRFCTVRSADLILVLEDGRIREFGGHDELMARHGLYASMYRRQYRAYRSAPS